MAIARFAWVLNLDADLELARPKTYSPSKGVLLAMRAHGETLRASLLRNDDLLIDESSPAGVANGWIGRAFCPTPRAIALLNKAGATLEPHPCVEALSLVNSRGFAAKIGQTLPNAIFATDLNTAVECLKGDPVIVDHWRIKRSFGMAGRGQRVLPRGEPSAAEIAVLRAAVREGGVQIEPNVSIIHEVAIHGELSSDGALVIGRLVAQECDRHGAWLHTEPAPHDKLAARMTEQARLVGAALHEHGYWGPFGVDAYEYRDKHGASHFQPRSEINARYSMGFSVGFPDAARRF